MDALLTIPREATPAVVFLRSEIPADHPSSSARSGWEPASPCPATAS
jgi:hypothetical protein